MEILKYPSANGLHDIKAIIWEPEHSVHGVIQIVHGMSEYGERYEDLALYLTGMGFAVCINDHAGHGESISDIYGYMGPKDGYRHIVTDVHTLYERVRDRYPEYPYFLLGHSMGSFVTRSYCSHYGGDLNGVILSGTGQAPVITNLGIAICRLACLMGKEKAPAKMLSKISNKSYNKTFVPHRTNSDWLSRDPEQVDKFIANPKSGFPFTFRGYMDLLLLLRSVSTPEWPGMMPKDLPIYLFSGNEDPVGNYGKDVTRIYESLKAAGCVNVTMKLYPGGRHEMINEINKDEVYDDLLKWLEGII